MMSRSKLKSTCSRAQKNKIKTETLRKSFHLHQLVRKHLNLFKSWSCMDFNEIQAGRLNFEFNIFLPKKFNNSWTNFRRLEMAIKNKSNRWCCVKWRNNPKRLSSVKTEKMLEANQMDFALHMLRKISTPYIWIKTIAIFTQKMKHYLFK